MSDKANNSQISLELQQPAALILERKYFTLLRPDGEIIQRPVPDLSATLQNQESLLFCYKPHLRTVSLRETVPVLDILELYAFVHPAQFCVPTPKGVAAALNLSCPISPEDGCFALLESMSTLLDSLKEDPFKDQADPLLISAVMAQKGKGWQWTPYIYQALGQHYDPQADLKTQGALRVWNHLPEWSERAPPPPASHHPVTGEESIARLESLLQQGEQVIEPRAIQQDYARTITAAFAPVESEDDTHVVLAEAGTGVGKTLGYLAPASVWAEKNNGTVWLSTYTKNLQRQIDQELKRLYPDPDVRQAKTAIRKGRENYLCLLNLEEATQAAVTAYDPQQAVAAGIMARWTIATRDGDLTGADFPGWLSTLLGFQKSTGLADRRGECIYAACDHYHRCFVERAGRKSAHARVVVANHALVMIQTALAQSDDLLPQRYIFDEGHHLFDAADSAFSAHLSMIQTRDLRQWLLGPEGGKVNRMRGLRRRIEDLVKGNGDAETALQAVHHRARQLPGSGWTKRLANNLPEGTAEQFFFAVAQQVHTRASNKDVPYSLECDLFPCQERVYELATEFSYLLNQIRLPIINLASFLRQRLHNDTEGHLSGDERKRLDSLASSLERRAHHVIAGWIGILDSLQKETAQDDFVEWMEITRIEGQAKDVGIYRHWIDPMRPFTASIKPHAHGIGFTSATLRDPNDLAEHGWLQAKTRTGTDYLSRHPVFFQAESPFDYANQTRIFLINDVRKDDPGQTAAAYEALFKASGGGALGLFTAVQRLKQVYHRITETLETQNITLYAQHIDDMDPGTLIDIFRDEINSCLLGTDAIRDGVDVPGEALRLIVFDRVPWPRPTILHRARRYAFGRKVYDDMITGLRLEQAFGRLIRKKEDRGVFVLLDPMLPSRLYNAFPDQADVVKCSLNEAIHTIKNFLK